MKKILVVEDDPGILLSITIRLQAAGHDVVTAVDAETGFQQACAERPDLVLLDVSMPAGNGFELAARIREPDACDGVPIVFMTASRRPEFRQRAADLGAVGFLEKPFAAEALLGTVEAALETAACAERGETGGLG